jgi:hypothetical protein
VDAGRDAADAGGDVVAGEGALAAFVEFALGGEREGHGGDGDALLEGGVELVSHRSVHHGVTEGTEDEV